MKKEDLKLGAFYSSNIYNRYIKITNISPKTVDYLIVSKEEFIAETLYFQEYSYEAMGMNSFLNNYEPKNIISYGNIYSDVNRLKLIED